MTSPSTPPENAGALKCSACRSAVPSPGLCDACRPRLAALRELSEGAVAKRRAASIARDHLRRDKVAVFAKLPAEQAARLLAEVQAERAARKAAR